MVCRIKIIPEDFANPALTIITKLLARDRETVISSFDLSSSSSRCDTNEPRLTVVFSLKDLIKMATVDDVRGHSLSGRKVRGGKTKRSSKSSELNEYLIDEEEDKLMRMPSSDMMDKYSISDEDDNYIAENDNDHDDHDEGEDNLSEDELHILQQLEETEQNDEHYLDETNEVNEDESNDRLYQSKLCKPIYSVGKTTIGLSKAKLFGLVDQTGKLKFSTANNPTIDKGNQYKRMQNMSKPREIDPSLLDREDAPTFKPSRTKEALAAMKNAKCGYDFVSRLNDDNSSFLDRVSRDGNKRGGGKLSKAQLDSMEQDYAVRQDKLQCPKCLKPQSFDEFIENKRSCSQCQMKFEKLNITSGVGFAARAAQRERERRDKLRAQEIALYGPKSESYQVPKILRTQQQECTNKERDANKAAAAANERIRQNLCNKNSNVSATDAGPRKQRSGKAVAGSNDKISGARVVEEMYSKSRHANEAEERTSSANGGPRRKPALDSANKMIISHQQDGMNQAASVVERLAMQNQDKARLLQETLNNLSH